MITRPLDLASRLRPPPRNFDALFLVNGALLVLFFLLFGSRFVLAPGLGVNFKLPEMAGAVDGAARTTVVISVPSSNMVLVEDGLLNYAQLGDWLKKRARDEKGLALLVRANRGVPLEDVAAISAMATRAGFSGGVQLAMEAPRDGTGEP
jgi:biopolymer transport protein ExbD